MKLIELEAFTVDQQTSKLVTQWELDVESWIEVLVL